MQNLNTVLRAIPAPDADAMARAQQHIDGLLKPPAASGVWRRWRCSWRECPAGRPAAGGEKGLAGDVRRPWSVGRRGGDFAEGGHRHPGGKYDPRHHRRLRARRQAGAKVHVIDVGIDSEPLPGVVNMRVARGCGNIARGPAMSREQGQELLLEVMRYTRALAQRALPCLASANWGWPIPRRRQRSSAS